ncbi:choline transport [Trichoderma arundinaceum]|uniref:Choline transport n=1 Tax=Trichoderma arundinaceum TaxID=490622 RepID=A0A395NNH9_TRIAR|nr:choline transport [Trichoderma arundinaceum]
MIPQQSAQFDSKEQGNTADNSPQYVESRESIQHGTTTEMTKNLNLWTLIAIAFNICNSWAGLAGSMNVALSQGGPVSLVYGLFISSSLYICIALTMAELASVYPTAGGQYHFVSILAPSSFHRSLSYACGMLANFSWVAIGAAINMIFSEELMTLVVFYHPNFIPRPWHQFLFYEAFGLAILLYNLLTLKKLPATHYVGFFLCISVFFGSFVAILVRSSPKAPSAFVWTTFINETGWPDGVCFLSSLLTTCFIYAGLDASLHLAEEASNPRVAVPRACVSAVIVGFITAFAYLIAMLYSIVDLGSILEFNGFLPFGLDQQALRSDNGAIAILVLSIAMTFFILNAVLQTASRLTWSMAKDNALIFSNILEKVHPSLDVPVSSLLFNAGVLALCGCIYLASSTGMCRS